MKKILLFDTETTGVKAWDDRIVQFGAIFGSFDPTTWEFFIERTINQVINPRKEIPQVCIDIHGITNQFAERFDPMESYIKEFLAYFAKADYIVGHNIDYDMRMLLGEIGLCNVIAREVENKKKICTMKTWAEFKGGKRPKLEALHLELIGKGFENAHDAMADITATKDVFLEMVKRWIIVL